MPPTRQAARKDKYPNIINVSVTMSAANTLTFQEVDLGFGQFERVGVLLSRMEMHPENGVIDELVAAADVFNMAISADNQLADINADERAVIDTHRLKAQVAGTAGTLNLVKLPLVVDYSNLPGGGMLIAPRPLYVGITSAGFASARLCIFRLYFTILKLQDADYFELLESRRFYG